MSRIYSVKPVKKDQLVELCLPPRYQAFQEAARKLGFFLLSPSEARDLARQLEQGAAEAER